MQLHLVAPGERPAHEVGMAKRSLRNDEEGRVEAQGGELVQDGRVPAGRVRRRRSDTPFRTGGRVPGTLRPAWH